MGLSSATVLRNKLLSAAPYWPFSYNVLPKRLFTLLHTALLRSHFSLSSHSMRVSFYVRVFIIFCIFQCNIFVKIGSKELSIYLWNSMFHLSLFYHKLPWLERTILRVNITVFFLISNTSTLVTMAAWLKSLVGSVCLSVRMDKNAKETRTIFRKAASRR